MYPFRMLLLIAITGSAAMVIIAPFDLQWTTCFLEHQFTWFTELMSESVFELEKPGGGDVVVIFSVICLLLYCASSLIDLNTNSSGALHRLQAFLVSKPTWVDTLRRLRSRLEFLVVASFCCSTLMVKTLKWIMARPRPKKIFSGTRPFSEWYEIGPYFLDEGTYRASFPSGHTASAITLISLAYVLIYTGSSSRQRLGGKMVMFAVLCFAVVMAVARVMTVAHWPTDVTFSIFAGWLLIHILFFYGFRLAELNDEYPGSAYKYCPTPPFRGIRLCWYLALVCLSLVGIVLGVRHFYYDRWPWLILAGVVSVPVLVYAIRQTAKEGLFSVSP